MANRYKIVYMVYRTAPSSMTLNNSNPVFKVTPFFDAEYLINGTRYRHSYNRLLTGTHALLKSVISSDLE